MEVIFEIILIKENQFQMKIYLCTFIIGSELFLVGKNSIHSKTNSTLPNNYDSNPKFEELISHPEFSIGKTHHIDSLKNSQLFGVYQQILENKLLVL